jgi:hypothetical protein
MRGLASLPTDIEPLVTNYFSSFKEVLTYALALGNSDKANAFLKRYIFGEHTVITGEEWVMYKDQLTFSPLFLSIEIILPAVSEPHFLNRRINELLDTLPNLTTLHIKILGQYMPIVLRPHSIDLRNLRVLKHLSIAIGTLAYVIPILFADEQLALQSLKIEYPWFNYPLPSKMPSLCKLHITSQHFNQPLPQEMPDLHTLFISSKSFNNRLTSQMPVLKSLTIISRSVIYPLPHLPLLESLSIQVQQHF